MSHETPVSRETSGASSGAAASLRFVFGGAALFIAFLLAAAIGGGGRAVFAICVGGGVLGALNLDPIMRLPPIGRLIVIILFAMAIVTAAAFTIDLGRRGW